MIRLGFFALSAIFPSVLLAQDIKFELESTSSYLRLLILSNASRLVKEESFSDGVRYVFPNQVALTDDSEAIETLTNSFFDRVAFSIDENVLVARIKCDCSVQSYSAGANLYVVEVREETGGGSVVPIEVQSGIELPVTMDRDLDVSSSPLGENMQQIEENREIDMKLESSGQFSFEPNRTLGGWKKRSSNERLESALKSRKQAGSSQSPSSNILTSSSNGEGQPQIRFVPTATLSGRGSMDVDESIDCKEIAHIDPLNWQVSDRPIDEIFLNRAVLIDDSGEFSRNEVWRMVNGYLALAMGAEASYTLKSSLNLAPSDPILSISEALDAGVLKSNFLSRAYSECNEALVWLTLMNNSIDVWDVANVASTFLKWPEHVQDAFSAQLAQIFRTSGFENEAGLVLRLSETNSDEVVLYHAENYAEQSETEDALRLLSDVVKSDGDLAPVAAAKLTTIAVEEGVEIGPRNREVLEVYAQERKGTRDESALLNAQILLSISDSDFGLAFLQLSELKELVDPSEISIILERISSKILALESDASYLREISEVDAEIFRQFPIENQNGMRSRVEELGFAKLAKELGQLRRAKPETIATSVESDAMASAASTDTYVLTDQQEGADLERSIADATDGVTAPIEPPQEVGPTPTTAFVAPIPGAISESSSLLSQVDELKDELEQLGL
jgi:hypothetical protein